MIGIMVIAAMKLELPHLGASQVALVVKNPPANAEDRRDAGSIPGLGRSPGEGNGNHSDILAQKIPWTEEPGRPRSIALQSQAWLKQLSTPTRTTS